MATSHVALRLGVGDVFTVCKSVLDICKTDEFKTGKDMKGMVAEMEMMREHLSVIAHCQSQSQSQTQGVVAGGRRDEVTPLVNRSLISVHRDLVNVHKVLEERRKSVHVLDQARVLLRYGEQLRAFEEGMKRHRESVGVAREVVETGEGRKRRESVVRLAGLVESEEMRRGEEGYGECWVREVGRLSGGGSVEDEQVREVPSLGSASGSKLIGVEEEEEEEEANRLSEGFYEMPVPVSVSTSTYRQSSKPAFRLDVFENSVSVLGVEDEGGHVS